MSKILFIEDERTLQKTVGEVLSQEGLEVLSAEDGEAGLRLAKNEKPDIILLDKDPSNPFLFTKQIKLGTPTGQTYNTTQFILTTNNGWTNFWRFDDGLNPELAVFNGGTNTDIPITTTPLNYLFVFDTYTGRIQAIKQ